MEHFKWALTLKIVFLLSACATTSISSYKDAEFKDSQYNSFVVYSNIDNQAQRKIIETHICKLLSKRNANCQVGFELFPPTRTFTDAQFKEVISNSGASALLTIELLDAYTKESIVAHTQPQTSSSPYGDPGVSTTSYSKSYSVVGKHKITLLDTKKSKNALVATTETESQLVDPSYSLAEKIVEQLDKDGFIQK